MSHGGSRTESNTIFDRIKKGSKQNGTMQRQKKNRIVNPCVVFLVCDNAQLTTDYYKLANCLSWRSFSYFGTVSLNKMFEISLRLPMVLLSLISKLWEQKTERGGLKPPNKYSQVVIMLKCKTPKQMRLENSQGHLLNFAAVINQEYYYAGPYRTWTNCFFKLYSGRHKSVFMVTTGRYKGRLANMKIKSSPGYHLAMLHCLKS